MTKTRGSGREPSDAAGEAPPDQEPTEREQDPDAPPGMRRVDRPGTSSDGEDTVADPEGDEDAGSGPEGEDPMTGAAPTG